MSRQLSESLSSRVLDRGYAWSPFVIALAVFLLLRPYDGIVHDARLYVGYVLVQWDAMGIGRDLMFLHDGQSGKTIFPRLFDTWIRFAGVGQAAIQLSFASLLFWFFAAWRLVGSISPSTETRAGRASTLLWATTLSTWYGGTGVFRYAEAFATPRPLSEALVMLALGGVLRRHTGGANVTRPAIRVVVELFLLALAALFHPLMALPGTAIWVWLQFKVLRRVLVLLGGALLSMLLFSVPGHSNGNELLAGLAHFDPTWFAVLKSRGALVLTSQWSVSDFARVFVHAITICVGLPFLPIGLRQPFALIGAAAVGGVLVTWLGSDVFRSVLLTQGQPWRVLWLVALFASIALLRLVRESLLWIEGERAHDQSSSACAYRLGGTLLLLLAWLTLEYSASSALLALAGALLVWGSMHLTIVKEDRRGLQRALVVVALLLWIALDGLQALVTTQVIGTHPDPALRWTWRNFVATGIPRAAVLLTILGHSLHASFSLARSLRAMPVVFSFAILWLALAAFDQRTPWMIAIEEGLEKRRVNPSRSVQGAVFWLDSDIGTWSILGAPTWGGAFQGISKVFDRNLALRWENRARLVDSIAGHGWTRRADTVSMRIDPRSLRIACEWPDGPETIVVSVDQVAPDVAHSIFELPVPKYSPPVSRSQPWRRQSRFAVVYCQ